jgi:hypothetical protein
MRLWHRSEFFAPYAIHQAGLKSLPGQVPLQCTLLHPLNQRRVRDSRLELGWQPLGYLIQKIVEEVLVLTACTFQAARMRAPGRSTRSRQAIANKWKRGTANIDKGPPSPAGPFDPSLGAIGCWSNIDATADAAPLRDSRPAGVLAIADRPAPLPSPPIGDILSPACSPAKPRGDWLMGGGLGGWAGAYARSTGDAPSLRLTAGVPPLPARPGGGGTGCAAERGCAGAGMPMPADGAGTADSDMVAGP